jgi:DNA polymerase-3 subunit gamma/tau
MSETKVDSPESEQYQVVALRYRPQAFGDLVGQGHVAQALSNAIESNRVGHAYLFTGARGVGKTSSARIFAKCLNCAAGPTPKPCNECDICKSVSVGEDVDVLEIDGASNRGIDEIRQLRSNAAIRPGRGRYKIYIIDEVHMLTQQAFNALLKTLEEPPAHVKFIFCTTDPQKIPITVLSRCQRYDFSPVQANEITNRLRDIATNEGVSASDEALQLLARRANGSMRDSQSLLEQLFSFCGKDISVDEVHQLLGTTDIGRIAEIASAMTAHDTTSTLNLIHQSISSGVDAGQLTKQLLGYFRDMMAMHVGCGEEVLLNCAASDAAGLREVGKQLGLQTILNVVQIIDTAIVRMQSSLHARTILEVAAVRVCNLQHMESISDLVKSLNSLPAGKTVLRVGTDAENSSGDGSSDGGKAVKKNEIVSGAATSGGNPSVSDQHQGESNGNDSNAVRATTSSVAAGQGSAPTPHISAAAASGVSAIAANGAGSAAAVVTSATTVNGGAASVSSPVAPSPSVSMAPPVESGSVESPSAGATSAVAASLESPAVSETATTEKESVHQPGTQVTAEDARSSEAGSSVGTQDLKAIYETALDSLADTTADMARNFESVIQKGTDRIEVSLRDAYHHTTCSRTERKSKIEEALQQVAGRRIHVEFTLSETAVLAQDSTPVLSRAQQIRELSENDFVKDAIKIFDAQIADYFDPKATRS